MNAANRNKRLGAARFSHLQSLKDGAQQRPSEPANRQRPRREELRRPANLMSNSLAHKQRVEYEAEQIKSRTRRLDWCFICLIGAIFSLIPFLSIHLNQRIGLFIFESDILLLRSSLINVIICLIFLIIFISLIIFLNKRTRDFKRSTNLQRAIKILIGLFATISLLAYLSLGFIVPQVRQIQRLPLATFDCNANEIVIENCHQQFLTNGEDQTTLEALEQLFLTDIGDKNERLIRQLNCFKYNNRKLETLRAPTRFLLDKCGLVCRPHRQQLYQFSDDLNKEQASDSGQNLRGLADPYSQLDGPINSTATGRGEQPSVENNLVSVKVCFLGDISGGSNYKRFCIENLTNREGLKSPGSYEALTVSQLNAILRNFTPEQADGSRPTATEPRHQDLDVTEAGGPIRVDRSDQEPHVDLLKLSAPPEVREQSTHYVNPVVQFESHFKNWPHITRTKTTDEEFRNQVNNQEDDDDGRFCKFKPIPPFIVNNKPFSDIQCSLEHDYTITSGVGHNSRPQDDSVGSASPPNPVNSDNGRIYLRKSATGNSRPFISEDNVLRERCNIQCKVNILYQVHLKSEEDEANSRNSYYLPLKPCLIVSGDGDKTRTFNQYMIFRSVGDSSLLLCFILFEILLLIESIDTRQFQLEGKKFRLISVMVNITFAPVLVSILFDLAAILLPILVFKSREGYLTTFVDEHFIPGLNNLVDQVKRSVFDYKQEDNDKLRQSNLITNSTMGTPAIHQVKVGQEFNVDNYLIPFFVYAIFMFALTINTIKLPLIASTAPLIRTTSTEELGMTKEQLPDESNEQPKTRDTITNTSNKNSLFTSATKEIRHQITTTEVVIFAMLTLFMGLQFNISQFTQNQVYIESFLIEQRSLVQQQHNHQHQSALLFVLSTQSIGSIMILVLILVFSDEMSSFLADFSPFKPMNHEDHDEMQQNDMNFKKFISISALAYSLRYLVLVNITSSSKLKWPLVIFYQASELLNFPLTWFTITSRAHQLIGGHFAQLRRNQKPSINDISHSQSVAFSGHLIVQSVLAFVYFALGRLLAMFVHSLHASLHLHSNNVDWFIESFYGEKNKQPENTSEPDQFNATTTTTTSTGIPQALITPLPDERQNYLHASRLFIKYNSLICFIVGSIFLVTYSYARYLLWKEKMSRKQAIARMRTPTQSDQQSDLIDDRLSLDLMQIHLNRIKSSPKDKQKQTKLHPPRPKGQKNLDREGQRARIHFHYDLGGRNSSDSSSISTPSKTSPKQQLTSLINSPEDVEHDRGHPIRAEYQQDGYSHRGMGEDGRYDVSPQNDPGDGTDGETTVEQVTTTKIRSKRVRIVDDGEVWSSIDKPGRQEELFFAPDEVDIATSPPPPSTFADNYDEESLLQQQQHQQQQQQQQQPQRKLQQSPDNSNYVRTSERLSGNTTRDAHPGMERSRRITFAPTTTLMGGNRQINLSYSSLGRNDSPSHHRKHQFTEDTRQMEIINRHRIIKSTTTTTSARRASPEPSIGGDEQEAVGESQIGEPDSIEMMNSRSTVGARR